MNTHRDPESILARNLFVQMCDATPGGIHRDQVIRVSPLKRILWRLPFAAIVVIGAIAWITH